MRDAALRRLRREASTTATLETGAGPASVFLEVFPRQPRLVIFGGVHIAVALVPLARALGYRTIVADGRAAFLTPRALSRTPTSSSWRWPEAAFEQIGLDASCYVCVLSHDPKFDEPALQLALRSPARYIGAIGSRKTQASRRERLRSRASAKRRSPAYTGRSGWTWAGASPAETALAILAEMTAVRYGGAAARVLVVATRRARLVRHALLASVSPASGTRARTR